MLFARVCPTATVQAERAGPYLLTMRSRQRRGLAFAAKLVAIQIAGSCSYLMGFGAGTSSPGTSSECLRGPCSRAWCGWRAALLTTRRGERCAVVDLLRPQRAQGSEAMGSPDDAG